jgi:hypothetical protein
VSVLIRWSGDGLSGDLTTSSAGPGDTPPSFITGATPTIEPSGERPPAIRFAQSGTTVNYAVWIFSATDLASYTIRGYLNPTAFPASDQYAVWKVVNAGETLASWALALTSTGMLRIMDKNGGTVATATTALTAGTWYRIEAIVNGDSTDVRAFTEDTTDLHAQVTATLPASVPGGRVRIGNDFGSPNAPPFWFDDLAIDNTPALVGPASTSNLYASLSEMKARFAITGTTLDDDLTRALGAASRDIDKVCGRRFYADTMATARIYYPSSVLGVDVDDFYSTNGLVVATDTGDDGVFETTWLSSDYQVEPLNGIVDGEPGWPYNRVAAARSRTFPVSSYRAPVQVTARWGWAAVPAAVREATLVLASELAKLKEAPFGVAGFGEFGPVRVRENPIAMRLLRPYVRHPVKVA